MFEEEYCEEHSPRKVLKNLLRLVHEIELPKSFCEVMYTATETHIFNWEDGDTGKLLRLIEVAKMVDKEPELLDKIRM